MVFLLILFLLCGVLIIFPFLKKYILAGISQNLNYRDYILAGISQNLLFAE